MGFLLSVHVDLPEDEWRDILRIARRRGVSRLEALPMRRRGLGDLQRRETRVLKPQEARELASALQADLDDPTAGRTNVPPVPRETVESVVRILGAGEPVRLEHTPPWKSGDEPPNIRGERS
jgi:hypothetical protein